MKLNYKILLFLSIIFILIFVISVIISINILKNNQIRNISLFKDEFINSYTEYTESMANAFFEDIETKVLNRANVNLDVIIEYLKENNEQSTIIYDLDGNQIYSYPGYEYITDYIIKRNAFQLLIKNSIIQEKKEFIIDNIKYFLKENSSSIIPTIIHFQIYENPKIIIGYVKSSNITSVRIRFIERMNKREIVNYFIIKKYNNKSDRDYFRSFS
jgi:hypothetical protein